MTLFSVAAVVLGGSALSGGYGTMVGSVIGALIIGLINSLVFFVGTPSELADLVMDWGQAGLSGVRLRPGVLPDDLHRITRELVPELQRRGAFRTAYTSDTLRGHFGLSRPANRYAA